MFLLAKKIFSSINFFIDNPQSVEDFQLINASFRLYTDLRWNGLVQDGRLFSCLKSIWDLLLCNVKDNFVPVEITLCPLISMWSLAPLSRDMELDIKQKLFSLKHNLKQVQAMCEMQLKDEFLERFPPSVSPALRLEAYKFGSCGNHDTDRFYRRHKHIWDKIGIAIELELALAAEVFESPDLSDSNLVRFQRIHF